MDQEQSVGVARAHQTASDDGPTKVDLQRRMEETREAIAQTVTEIKDTVADQYQSVKDSVAETLDWREQFRKHPAAWSLGALSVGYVIGKSVAAAFNGTKQEDQLLSQLAALGDRFTDELSKRGMNILVPALSGTILVPMLTSKINELFGIDLSDIPDQLLAQANTNPKGGSKGKKGKKNNGTKKNGKKKLKTV